MKHKHPLQQSLDHNQVMPFKGIVSNMYIRNSAFSWRHWLYCFQINGGWGQHNMPWANPIIELAVRSSLPCKWQVSLLFVCHIAISLAKRHYHMESCSWNFKKTKCRFPYFFYFFVFLFIVPEEEKAISYKLIEILF